MFQFPFFRNIMFVGTEIINMTYLLFKNTFDINHNIQKQTLNIKCANSSHVQNPHLQNPHLQNPHLQNIKNLNNIEAYEYIKNNNLKYDIEIINTYLELFSEKFDVELINYLKIII